MSWLLPPYNMEVAIVVIVVFIIVLLLVIIFVRLCTKYNCASCCDSDTDSVDDLEEELNDDAGNQSDGDVGEDDDDTGEHHPQVVVADPPISDRDFEARCCYVEDDEEELTQGADYPPGLAHDGKLQMEDEHEGEEFLINKMEESLL